VRILRLRTRNAEAYGLKGIIMLTMLSTPPEHFGVTALKDLSMARLQ
jgi:hypothetical protein